MSCKHILFASLAAAGLSACGDTSAEQALLGGATGAAGAAIVNGNAVAGAAVGAAANVLYCAQNESFC